MNSNLKQLHVSHFSLIFNDSIEAGSGRVQMKNALPLLLADERLRQNKGIIVGATWSLASKVDYEA